MLTVFWRKAVADLRSQRLQYSLIFVMLAVASMALTVALIVHRSADTPWERTFEETNGPHVWFVGRRGHVDFSALGGLPEISETTGEIRALDNHPVIVGDEKRDIFLYAMDRRPGVARPKVVSGRWLSPEAGAEVVLDASLATYYRYTVGDEIAILTAAGTRQLRVVGLAVTAHWFPYDDTTRDVAPGVAYVHLKTLEEIEPDPEQVATVLGLRLHDPQQSQAFVEQAHQLLRGQIVSSLEWQWLSELAVFGNRMNVLFLGFFSLLGLAAVGLIITNNIGGQVLAQYREIGLLKALGLRPGQVAWFLVLQNLLIGLPATLTGLALGIVVAPAFASPIANLLHTSAPAATDPGLLLSVFLVTEGAVALFTLLPAWHAGRIDAVQAISLGFVQRHHRPSRLAALAGHLRLPPIFILGVKDLFSRPLRAVITITGLVLVVVTAVFGTGASATLENLGRNRTYFQGTPADLRVERNFMPDEETRAVLAARPEVTTYYGEFNAYGWVSGQAVSPVQLRALADDHASFDFNIQEGRMFAAPGEAVAGAGLLTLLGARVGDEVTLIVEGRPLTLTIVGRYMEFFNLGRVALIDLKTLQQQLYPGAVPQVYGLALARPETAASVREHLLQDSGDQFDVLVTSSEPTASARQLQAIANSLTVLLLLIAGTNLLSASLLGVRERVRDFGIQKTVGMTPAQIAAGVLIGVTVLALLALVLGIPLGLVIYDRFMTTVAEQIGAGPGFAHNDWRLLALLLPAAVLLAVVSSLLPARYAARFPVTEALRYE